jgi:hypothetical protein
MCGGGAVAPEIGTMSASDSLVDQSKRLEPQMNADERKWRITYSRSSAFICGSKRLLVLPPSIPA